MRKALAGSLIRLAHRIYRPQVTEEASWTRSKLSPAAQLFISSASNDGRYLLDVDAAGDPDLRLMLDMDGRSR